MSSSAVLDADASRPLPGILTPTSEGSLNRRDGDGGETPESRKRRRADAVAMDHLLKPSIAVKVCAWTLLEQDLSALANPRTAAPSQLARPATRFAALDASAARAPSPGMH